MGDGRLARWSPLAGIAFVALLVTAGVIFSGEPAPGASDEELLAYYGKDGNQTKLEVASLLVTFGGALFLWFLGSLSAALRRSEGEPGWLSRIALASGATFAAVLVVGSAFSVFVPDAVDDDPAVFRLDPDTARLITNAAYTLVFESALPLAAPLVLAVSLACFREALFPRWLGWAGLVVALGCVLGFLGVTLGLFYGWVVVVAVYLSWRRTPETAPSNG